MTQTEAVSPVLCRICGQTTSFTNLHFQTNGGYILQKCDRCESVIVDSRPTHTELERTYDILFWDGEYEQHRNEHQALLAGKNFKRPYQQGLLRRIERLAPGKTMVEIGGGTGAFGAIVVSKGWRYSNYDISKVAVDFVNQLGLEAEYFEETTLPPIPRNSADVIVMWEVIEHIWAVHEYLVRLRDSLRHNGLLAVSTPNLQRRGYMASLTQPGLGSPPIHLNFFSQQSLHAALATAGFAEINFIHRRIYRPQPNFQSLSRHFRIALGIEATKTLYAIARR